MAPARRRRLAAAGVQAIPVQGTRARGAGVRQHRQPPGRRPRRPDRSRQPGRRQRGAPRGGVPAPRPARELAGAAAGALGSPVRARPGAGRASSSSSTGASPRASLSAGLGGPSARAARGGRASPARPSPRSPPTCSSSRCASTARSTSWERLGWIVDVAELIARRPGLDWAGVLARAGEAGHGRELLLGCLLARDLLGTRVARGPVPRRGRLIPAAGARADGPRPSSLTTAHGHLGLAETARFHLGVRGTWRARLAYFRYAMMPTVADWTRSRCRGGSRRSTTPAGGAPAPGSGVRTRTRCPGGRATSGDQEKTLPVVRRPSRSRCACAASASGNVAPMRSLSSPFWIQPRTSPARRTRSSRDAV